MQQMVTWATARNCPHISGIILRSALLLMWGGLGMGAVWLGSLTEAMACSYRVSARITSNLNVRSGPGTQHSIVGSIDNATCLRVLSQASGTNVSGNSTWYSIIVLTGSSQKLRGWVSGYYTDCSGCGGAEPACVPDERRACYTGPAATRNKGPCKDGSQTCQLNSQWGGCSGEVKPSAEQCDGQDTDCDGQPDNGNPGGGKSCSTGQPGTCGDGTSFCEGGRLVCKASTPSSAEVCDGKDNNCDGHIDEGNPQGGQPCDAGKPGECKTGTSRCDQGKIVCESSYTPSPELCDNKDNDCNGLIDDTLERSCYSGPPNTNGVGECKGGKQICVAGNWSDCQGEVKPTTEVCGNGKDDDCNGSVDENCTEPQGKCEDKDGDGYGVGTACKAKRDCDDNDPSVHPGAQEICGNGKDDDCEGGDLPCGKLNLGDEGCKTSDDCLTKLCVRYGNEQRCSSACTQNADCTSGYSCVQQQACWPLATKPIPPSDFAKPCKYDQQCSENTKCQRGFCLDPAQGCGCTEYTNNLPKLWLPLLLLLLGLFFLAKVRWAEPFCLHPDHPPTTSPIISREISKLTSASDS